MNVPSSLPSTVDLSQYAPAAGNQGSYGSCASWATGYSTMGWWANKTGLGGTPFNPVFLYTQLMAQSGQACGDVGTAMEDPLGLMQSEGDAPLADFPSSVCTQPTSQQIQNAGAFRISGFHTVDLSAGGRQALETAIAGGQPVAIAIWVYDELMNANASDYYVGLPAPNSTLYGAHAVAAMKYDDNGVWILNSWGTTTWGNDGWAELSWDFVAGTTQSQGSTYPNVYDAVMVDGVVGGGGGSSGSGSGSGGGGGSSGGSGSGGGSSGGVACTFPCSSYGYVEGQCVQGWECAQGCITDDGCQDGTSSGGGSGGSGGGSGGSSGGGSCTFACTAYGYAEGQCVQGWQCTDGCITDDGCQ
jgi:uncharacterized membrane protein YgcG